MLSFQPLILGCLINRLKIYADYQIVSYIVQVVVFFY